MIEIPHLNNRKRRGVESGTKSSMENNATFWDSTVLLYSLEEFHRQACLGVALWECGYWGSKVCWQKAVPPHRGEGQPSSTLMAQALGDSSVFWSVQEMSGVGLWHFPLQPAFGSHVKFFPQSTFLKIVIFFLFNPDSYRHHFQFRIYNLGLNCRLPQKKLLISFTSLFLFEK